MNCIIPRTPFQITQHNVGHGNIGLFGKLGYVTELNGVPTDEITIKDEGIYPISMHAPSKLIIKTDIELVVKGYCSTTSKSCPILTFKCDEKIIGTISVAGRKTLPCKLHPGNHELIIEANTAAWAHSIWLFYTYPRYYRINFNRVGPTGLLNQLINFVNGLIIGHLTNRIIYEPTFLPNYNSLDSISYSEIVDTDHLNILLKTLGLDVSVSMGEHLDKQNWYKPSYYSKFFLNPALNSIVDTLTQDDQPYIDLGIVFGFFDTTADLGDKRLRIYKEMRFRPQYYDVVKYCVSTHLNNKYNVVHLRLEDDWVNYIMTLTGETFDNLTKRVVAAYIQGMSQLFSPNDTIYIATHLLKSENKNNPIMYDIKRRYPNAVFSISWRDKFPNIPIGREIDALVDFLICRGAGRFIGWHQSTFSIMLNAIRSPDKGVSLLV